MRQQQQQQQQPAAVAPQNRDRPKEHGSAGLIEGGPSVLPSPAQLLHASREDNHAERVHMATRGCEGAMQRKQKVVKSEGDKIIRKWVQELVRFYPSGERGYDILEVKSLKRITRYDEKNKLAWFLGAPKVSFHPPPSSTSPAVAHAACRTRGHRKAHPS